MNFSTNAQWSVFMYSLPEALWTDSSVFFRFCYELCWHLSNFSACLWRERSTSV